ncbi:hypothetical protein [Bremerella sp. P1]|uniref:hypothetical protein n=1 Tax=Bremerella sp. P1 TaxID=3026424 RepID=UPI00236798BD|nr:hypothetical protein [Bremerella sp. P1]WDI40560.1 hypothetical protein PSR63_18965 [Bremerella sp. P1]
MPFLQTHAFGELIQIPIRSLLPVVAILVIAGTWVWGPWGTLIVAYLSWDLARRIA